MQGTWYSNTASGECKASANNGDDNGDDGDDGDDDEGDDKNCWWRIAETRRTVNQTCVNDRLVAAVQKYDKRRCWQRHCPDATQAQNRSAACFLDCLFETILGNATTGRAPVPAAVIATAFADAIGKSDPAEGGCPLVRRPPPSPEPSGGGDGAGAFGRVVGPFDWKASGVVPRVDPFRQRRW